jgi:hypothetical protein
MLSASVKADEAVGEARLGGGSPESVVSGATTKAFTVTDAKTVTATAETVVQGISIANGALRMAAVRSRSVTRYTAGAANPETATELVVEGGQAGGLTFAFGSTGLVVANQGIPLPVGQGLEALNQALAPAGVGIRFVGPGDVAGGRSSDVVEVRYAQALPTGGNGAIRWRFGGTTTAVTTGGALPESPLLPAEPPPSSFEVPAPPTGPAGVGSDSPPSVPAQGLDTVGSSPGLTSHDLSLSAGIDRGASPGPVTAGASTEKPSPVGPASGPALSQAMSVPRRTSSVGAAYGVLAAAAVALLFVSSIWRRGALSL